MSKKAISKLTILCRLLYWGVVVAGVVAFVAYLIPPSRDVRIPVIGVNGKWGYVNDSGRVIEEFEWDGNSTSDLTTGELTVGATAGRYWGPENWYVQPSGKYDEAGMAMKKVDGRVGWVGRNGEWIIQPDKWVHASEFDEE